MRFSGFKTEAWKDMRFSEFLNKTWDANDFCHLLALDARANILSEMAMGTDNISKMPVLWDQDDWKFLYQFPKEMWNQALRWRYNDGLRAIMNFQEHDEDIPEGYNWTDHLIFVKPNTRKENISDDMLKKWMFGKQGGPKNIYIGLTDLAHKLTDPHKGPESSDETQPYWAGEGPGIHEVDPDQQDPNHAKHRSKYKHGLYDFDLSKMAEVSPDYIRNMPDYEVHEMLPEKLKALDVSHPDVKKAIKAKKKGMLDNLKHTMAGYSVLQQNKASEHMGNWVKANALPEKLLGEHPSEIEDPYDADENGKIKRKVTQVPISQVLDSSQLEKSALKGTIVPVVQKKLRWTEYDPKTGKETPKEEEVKLPILNNSKTIPTFELTDNERLQLAQRRGYKVIPGETYAEAAHRLGSGFVQGARLGDLQGLLDNWDMFSDERKAWMKQHVKDLFHVSQTEHAGHKINPETMEINPKTGEPDPKTGKPYGDPHANPTNKSFYAAGFYPNYGTPKRAKFRLPADKIDAFVKKYKGRIYAELAGSEEKGKAGENENSMIYRILRSMKKSERYPKEVIDALESSANSGDLTTFLTYMLLGWLDSPSHGIKDDEIGLLPKVSWEEYDEKANKKKRQDLVFNFMSSIAQYGNADVLTRRQRERYGVATKSSIDAPVGDTGQSGAGNVANQGSKGENKIDTSAKRAYLHSGTHTVVRASHKASKAFSNVGLFMAAKRNYVLSKLQKVPGVAAELDKAEERITAGVNTSIAMFESYQKEHPEASEEEIMKYVHANLQAELQKKHPALFGDIKANDKDMENIFAKTKGLSKTGVNDAVAKQMMGQYESEIYKFVDKFIHDGEGHVPIYNAQTNEFKEGPHHTFEDFKNNPDLVITFLSVIVPEQFAEIKPKLIKEKGLPLFIAAVFSSDDNPYHNEEQAEKAWNKAYTQWLAGEQTQQQPQAAQAQTQPAAPTPMPQAAAQPQAQAAKSIPELFNAASTVNSPADIIQVAKEFLAKKNELLAMPGSALKLQAAIKAMRARRQTIVSSAPSMEEQMLINSLNKLIGEIHATQAKG